MKTTIDIADPLLREARRLAAKEGVTVKALVEQGLRRVIAEKKTGGVFRLRKASFRGKGLQAGAKEAGWDRLRALAYQGRGG